MAEALPRWQSRADGEYRLCTRCAHLGYGEDAYHPATHEFWPRVHGQLWFGRCLACASELQSRRLGVVPALSAPRAPALLMSSPRCRGYTFDFHLTERIAAHG